MITNIVYETEFWDILTRAKLANLSQFHKPNVFEEVPLYTRYSDLEFLKAQSTPIVNATVLGFALKFLNSVISYQQHRSSYFASITVWEPLDVADPIVPNLFFWSGNAERAKRFKKQLVLDRITTPFGKLIKQLVGAGTHPRFSVLEDRSTLPDECRVFISLAQRPYPSFLPLEELRRPAKGLVYDMTIPTVDRSGRYQLKQGLGTASKKGHKAK